MSKATDPWMPFYIRDYLGDTRHLSTLEHGAYLLLIFSMWLAGGALPNDDAKLARIAGVTPKEWAKMSPTIMRFFRVRFDEITHSRVSEELAKSNKIVALRSVAGKRGAEKRWQNSGGVVVPLVPDRE